MTRGLGRGARSVAHSFGLEASPSLREGDLAAHELGALRDVTCPESDALELSPRSANVAAMRTVVLEIAGAKYRLTTDADEGHLRRLAEKVNDRIEALGTKAVRTGTPAQLLAVVALGLVEELEETQERHAGLKARAAEVVADAVARIDGRLAALARLDEA